MKIEEIDKNFAVKIADRDGEFYVVKRGSPYFDVYGVCGQDETGMYRVPPETAKKVSENVSILSRDVSGAVVRFSTDSKHLTVRATEPTRHCCGAPHFALTGSGGFDLYEGKKLVSVFIPPKPDLSDFCVEQPILHMDDDAPAGIFRDYTLNLPLYSNYKEIAVKVDDGATIRKCEKGFRYEKPFVFYGSSITEGACAARPGTAYINRLSRELNLNCYSLGFSGSAHGEEEMARFIASMDMECLVMDYDFNSDLEELAEHHERFFKLIRLSHPDLPVLFASAIPVLNPMHRLERREIIYTTYQNALDCGDRHVYFVDGTTFFDEQSYDNCTVDGVHPTDLGFYYMYKGFRKAIEQMEGGKYAL